MTWRARLNLPREHGAWAMFYAPLVLGIIIGGGLSWPVVWLIIAASALFISRESLLLVWRSRLRGRLDRSALLTLTIDGLLAATGGLLLLFRYHYWLLLWLALPGLLLLILNGWQATRRADRTIATEVLAIGGMTLAAPAAHYVASRGAGRTGRRQTETDR
ncbi:MAG: YwiC-like family protein, partial [Acidobacteriota bacterium]